MQMRVPFIMRVETTPVRLTVRMILWYDNLARNRGRVDERGKRSQRFRVSPPATDYQRMQIGASGDGGSDRAMSACGRNRNRNRKTTKTCSDKTRAIVQ